MSLSRYTIEEELFTVGPSTFYRARSAVLGNTLLLRRLAIDPTRAENVRETFFREMRHTAMLQHPRIQTPHDVFEEDGFLWSVGDWVEIRPTSELVESGGPMPLAEAARLGSQICDALAMMHERDLLHGKITPRVVLLDATHDAMLINFVKSADLAAGIWPLRPAVLGLSPFTAPEEFSGAKPTPKSDLYAMAGTLVYWLTGHVPRGGDDAEAQLERARDGAPLLDLETAAPALPTTLREALLLALEVDPEARRGSVSALGALLAEIHLQHVAEIPSGFTKGEFLAPHGETQNVEILARHGAGAFGVVLRARESETQRVLAVKALKPQHRDDTEARERFLREARALQKIHHDNVVRIVGVGERDGTPYAVMEFIEGPDLATFLLREGTPSPARVAKIGARIAEGLAAIHAESIIHRDLKPHNILLASEDRPVIADFGVARSETTARMTQTGHLVGTPAYMAPEQFLGGSASPAVDMFALGTILYEMLSGKPPFTATDTLQLIRKIRTCDPEPLPDTLDEGLKDIVQHLLEKDPEDRLSDAGKAAAALHAFAR